MQKELSQEFDQLDIQLLGVNHTGHEIGNENFTNGVDLPWLGDLDANEDGVSDTWDSWNVDSRDVVILDGQNHAVATYNLTTHDISESENYAELKDLLVTIASSEQETGTIGGHVYFDVNQNGSFDSNETPLSGVTIQLTGTAASGDSVDQSMQTLPNGSFSFQGLSAGSYSIIELQPTMTIDGQETTSIESASIGEDQFSMELGVGEDAMGFLFAERGRQVDSISLSDFLASTPTDGIVLATNFSATQWYCLLGDWQQFQSTDIAIGVVGNGDSNSTTTQFDLTFRDVHGHRHEGQFTSDMPQVTVFDRQNNSAVMRISGDLIDMTAQEENDDEQGDESPAEGESTGVTGREEYRNSRNWPDEVDLLMQAAGPDENDLLSWS